MARFNMTGLEAVIKDMARMGENLGPVADEMLNAGAEVVRQEWQKAISQAGHIDTGAMFGSVKPTKIKTSGDVRTLTVYPQGTDGSGTRNAEKAFIANYGRKAQAGSGFVAKAEEAAEGPAQAAMEAVWDRFLAGG